MKKVKNYQINNYNNKRKRKKMNNKNNINLKFPPYLWFPLILMKFYTHSKIFKTGEKLI